MPPYAPAMTRAARDLLGAPFRHQGREPQTGVDCVGFWLYLARVAGCWPAGYVDAPRYGRGPQASLGELVARYCEPAPEALEGALITIAWRRGQIPSHVAYCTGATLIHCYERAGRVVEHGYREPWLRLTTGRWLPRLVR